MATEDPRTDTARRNKSRPGLGKTTKATTSSSGAEPSVETEKTRRKRTQNRISQRCLREKQVAQTRQMTVFQDLLKATRSKGDGDGDRRLVEEGLRLMQENQEMREALLRMRKKLLSLSNSSAVAAGKHPAMFSPLSAWRHSLSISLLVYQTVLVTHALTHSCAC